VSGRPDVTNSPYFDKTAAKQMSKWLVFTEDTVKVPALRFGFSLPFKAYW
jgi:hypothetical protein